MIMMMDNDANYNNSIQLIMNLLTYLFNSPKANYQLRMSKDENTRTHTHRQRQMKNNNTNSVGTIAPPIIKLKLNFVALVRERTMPTDIISNCSNLTSNTKLAVGQFITSYNRVKNYFVCRVTLPF
jgi:hypothetical protein